MSIINTVFFAVCVCVCVCVRVRVRAQSQLLESDTLDKCSEARKLTELIFEVLFFFTPSLLSVLI